MKRWKQLSERAAKRITIGLLVLGAALLGTALYVTFGASSGYTVTTYSMGSYVQQTVTGGNEEEAAREAANAVAELEDLISWRKEGSDIAKLNDAAGTDFLALDERTQEILRTSLSVCSASGGAFDITIAPLSRLWDFDENPHLPEADRIAKFLPSVDYASFSLLEDGTAALQRSGMALDLGAVGKGAACDAAAASYASSGVDRAVVAVGGSVGVYGEKPFGEPWKIAVRDPRGDGSLGELAIREGFVSTSGSYEKQFTEEGRTYHHLLDPKTGYPAESGLVSVTVWSGGGALSDALSTACFVLGLEESLPVLEQFDAGAVFITEENEIYVTEALQGAFTLSGSGYTLRELPSA